MLLRRPALLLAAALLALGAPALVSAKKPSLFNRIVSATTGRRTQVAGTGLSAEALKDVVGTAGDNLGEMVKQATEGPKEDAWAVDPELRLLSKLMEGDHMSIFQELVKTEGLDEVWSNTTAVARILEGMPMLEAIRGVPEIMAKAKAQQLQPDDGRKVLKSLKTIVTAYADKMGSMTTSDGIAGLFQRYTGEGAPEKVKALQTQLEQADTEEARASLQRKLQQAIADDVWEGLIDLDKFGLDGTEPRGITESRAKVMEEQPAVWDLITQGDPLVKKILENPMKAAEIVMENLDPADRIQLPSFT